MNSNDNKNAAQQLMDLAAQITESMADASDDEHYLALLDALNFTIASAQVFATLATVPDEVGLVNNVYPVKNQPEDKPLPIFDLKDGPF